MEKFPCEPHLLFQLLYLLLLSSLLYSSATNSSFINCGSNSDITVDNQPFVGDGRKSDFYEVGESEPIRNSSVMLANTSLLYQTARIYRKQSFYELEITENGIYLVRLHFFPFISNEGTNLSDAKFDVSTSKSLLFSARNGSDFQVINEYFFSINPGKFRINFIPVPETSFAFVNAIEVILLPNGFIRDYSNSLRALYRLNVGGPMVDKKDDLLYRDWVEDDKFLVSESSVKNCPSFTGNKLDTSSEGESLQPIIAPEVVYRTCKQMNSNFSNVTWDFNVRKGVRHLVRFHFCDIISESLGLLKFNLYFYSNFTALIDPSDNTSALAAPFFYDVVVDSDDSGLMNITLGLNKDSDKRDAFLNGLEVMEFVKNETRKFFEPVDRHSSRHFGLLIGFSVGGTFLLLILIMVTLFVVRRRRSMWLKAFILNDEVPQGRDRPHSWIAATSHNSASPIPNFNLKLRMPLSEILVATCNFDTKLLIGEGGFGKVYKGTLPNDGMKVAVKRSDSSHGQGLPEFQTEVNVLSSIRHRHLVSLIGYCDEGGEMILVYEFMEKGTLRDHLYVWKENIDNASKLPGLTWKQRLEICIGAAKGLHYLHTGSDWGIIHRDVKSTNILLDEHYVARVADFGLSQSGPPGPDQSDIDLIGSFGYLDPEYIRTFQLTYKSDVYSFGVVLLEVLCARAPIINSTRREEINLAEWGMFWQKKGQLEEIIDPVLAGQINLNSLKKFGEIVERCLEMKGTDRPSMLDVCWDLEYALQLQQTAVYREPHDDSTIEVSSNYVFPVSSSTHFSREEDCLFDVDDDDEFDSKLVFSQSRINSAR